MADLEPRPEGRPPEQRIGYAERERAAEVLRTAAGDGRITLEELDQRLERAYAAQTAGELTPITADLETATAHVVRRPGAGLEATEPQRLVAVFGEVDRGGVWTVPSELRLVAVMGSGSLDFRRASFSAAETVLDLTVVMGGCEIIVGPDTRVVLEGSGVMGSFAMAHTNTPDEATDDSPVLRVRGTAFWGGVAVYRKRLRSERPK